MKTVINKILSKNETKTDSFKKEYEEFIKKNKLTLKKTTKI